MLRFAYHVILWYFIACLMKLANILASVVLSVGLVHPPYIYISNPVRKRSSNKEKKMFHVKKTMKILIKQTFLLKKT